MKTKIILFLSLFCIATGFSQEKKERIKALKVAYITEKLELTTQEAQKFWPIYNAFDEEQFQIRHEKMRGKLKNIEPENFNALTENEAKQLLNEMEQNEDKLYQLRKKFMKDVQNVLPAKKIILLKKTEDDFNRKLLKEFRGRKH